MRNKTTEKPCWLCDHYKNNECELLFPNCSYSKRKSKSRKRREPTFKSIQELIKVPRKLLRVEVGANYSTMEKHLHQGKPGYHTIVIYTDKGTYKITSCSHCNALFWEKIQSSIAKAKKND